MNTPDIDTDAEDFDDTDAPAPKSRFVYYGEEDAGEGGVFAAAPADAATPRRGTIAGGAGRGTPGVPGPTEALLDISELARTVGMHYTHHFAFPAGNLDELATTAPTTGEITLTNAGALLILRGRVESTLDMECGRCLSPAAQPVEAELEEEFDLVPTNNTFHQEEVQAIDEDTPAAVIKGNVLNLVDLLRQNLLLAAPLQPLCREDCPGILLDNPAVTVLVGEAAEAAIPVSAPLAEADNPLRHLAELLEAKRRGDADRN